MDRIAAARFPTGVRPRRRSGANFDSAATNRRVDPFAIGAAVASARAHAIAVGIAAILFGGGIGGTSDGPVQVASAPYRVIDGKVDAHTYNGYRRYHAGCNHCHRPDGLGGSFAPSLVAAPLDPEAFGEVVREGRANGNSVMKGFAADGDVEPYVDDIYAYLRARADGVLGRGRPARLP